MTWFKVDDDSPAHEKFSGLCEGPCRGDAVALWMYCGCWSSKALREGFVPSGVVRSYGFHPDAASELIRVGLWYAVEGGYRFHDWADYQPSADQVAARRKAAAERKAKQRARLSASKVPPSADPDDTDDCDDVGVSRQDIYEVTPESRIQSRPCLADAARDTGTGDSGSFASSGSESEIACARVVASEPEPLPSPRAPVVDIQVNLAAIGYRWLDDALGGGGKAPDLYSWQRYYASIGAKPARERALVAKHMMSSDYIIEKPRKAKPDHIMRFWDDFVAGPKHVLGTYGRPGPAKRGPSPVPEHSDYVEQNQLAAAGGDPCLPF